jgi:hypothetical protein
LQEDPLESSEEPEEEEEEFGLPSYIEDPKEGTPEFVDFSKVSNISLAKVNPEPALPMPYGHPCYFEALSHYQPPTFIDPGR